MHWKEKASAMKDKKQQHKRTWLWWRVRHLLCKPYFQQTGSRSPGRNWRESLSGVQAKHTRHATKRQQDFREATWTRHSPCSSIFSGNQNRIMEWIRALIQCPQNTWAGGTIKFRIMAEKWKAGRKKKDVTDRKTNKKVFTLNVFSPPAANTHSSTV